MLLSVARAQLKPLALSAHCRWALTLVQGAIGSNFHAFGYAAQLQTFNELIALVSYTLPNCNPSFETPLVWHTLNA